MKKKKRIFLVLLGFIIIFLVIGLVINFKRDERLLRTISADYVNENDFTDIEFIYTKNLEKVDLDADLAKKNAVEQYGSSTIKDISKYNIKAYRLKYEGLDGFIFFSETSEYSGFHESDSDEFIFNKIINGITTNHKNVKIKKAWTIEFQDGTNGYMYSFYNRIGDEMLYQINMECWSDKYYYALEAITPYNDNWDYLMDEVFIIIGKLKHKNLKSIQDALINPYDLFDSRRVNNIIKDYLKYMKEGFRLLCKEADAFCDGLSYNISSVYQISKNVYGVDVSIKRYDLEKSAKQLYDKSKEKLITLQGVIDYAKEQSLYIECKTILEINLNTGEIVPDIHFDESFYAEGFSYD